MEAEMADVGSFGDWLKQARKGLDFSQRDLAQQVSCALVTIQKIEAARRRPSQQLAGLLARALAITPEDTERFLTLARVPTLSPPADNHLPVADLTRLLKRYQLEAEALLVNGDQEAAAVALELAICLEAAVQLRIRLTLLAHTYRKQEQKAPAREIAIAERIMSL
jgi:transcriptional regulator with XRE-family HTH domain